MQRQKAKHIYDKKDIKHINNFDIERYITIDVETKKQSIEDSVRTNKSVLNSKYFRFARLYRRARGKLRNRYKPIFNDHRKQV